MRTEKTGNKFNKRILAILAISAVIGLILSTVLFLTEPAQTTVAASIQFSFKDAADGIAPNGNRFDVEDITDDEVLNAALTAAGMDDRYTAEQIRSSLSATGVYPENLQKQMTSYDSLLDFTTSREFNIKKFHPTQFSIQLTNEFDPSISKGDMEKLLGTILQAYKAHFIQTYSVGFDTTGYDQLFDLTGYDYPQMLQVTEMEMSQIATYAEAMYEADPTFTYNGMGFNDIYIRMQNLVDNDIVRMNANLTMNALTKDTQRLVMQYECEIRDRENELEKKNAELASLDKLLEAYDKNEIIYLSTSDSLTKIDGNSSETYDALVERRKEVADEITALKSEIKDYKLKLADLLGTDAETGTANTEAIGTEETTAPVAAQATATVVSEAVDKTEQIQALEADIANLLTKKDTVMNDFSAMLQYYNDTQLNDSTVATTNVKYHSRQLLSGAFIKSCIKTAGPIFVIGLLICLILKIRKEKKAA